MIKRNCIDLNNVHACLHSLHRTSTNRFIFSSKLSLSCFAYNSEYTHFHSCLLPIIRSLCGIYGNRLVLICKTHFFQICGYFKIWIHCSAVNRTQNFQHSCRFTLNCLFNLNTILWFSIKCRKLNRRKAAGNEMKTIVEKWIWFTFLLHAENLLK